MNKIQRGAYRLLIDKWTLAKAQLEKLAFEVRPDDPFNLFAIDDSVTDEGILAFDVKPITFFVSERAAQTPDLYIAVRARIALDRAAAVQGELHTVRFGTEVAYFREGRGGLQHIYGAHFDHAENEIGHPVFHAQMRSYSERVKSVEEAFQLNCECKDLVAGVLRTVRVPTAQMDFFALLVQVGADHLINKDSGDNEREAFDELRRSVSSIRGVGHLLPQLAAAQCTRGVHWYPRAAVDLS